MRCICLARPSLALLLLLVGLREVRGAAPPVDPPEVAWAHWDAELVALLARYLRLDTTNPPGNEVRAAAFLEAELAKVGVRAQRYAVAPGRDNLIARVRGTGSARPLVLTHHTDVVGAVAADWKQPPFSGALVDGELWGRGALDMKATGVVHLLLMQILAARKQPLARDVIFLALADEEVDSSGARDLVERHPELVRDAEFLINEGAVARQGQRGLEYYAVSPMEKAALWLQLEARGPDGHGSAPLADSAINRLVAALARIQATPTPIVLTPAVASYLAGSAATAAPALRVKLRDVARHLGDAAFVAALTADPLKNALLRDTIAVTGLTAGSQVNVIPATATARLDCRLLPGRDKTEFLAWLRRVVADDAVVIRELSYTPGLESPLDTALVRAIRQVAQRRAPGVPVFTLPLISTTDSSRFRALGIHAYGFEPFALTPAQEQLSHAADERIAVATLREGLRFLYEVVITLASP